MIDKNRIVSFNCLGINYDKSGIATETVTSTTTLTSTVTATTIPNLLRERNGLVVGTAMGGFCILVLGTIATFLYRSRKGRGRRLEISGQQIQQQQQQLQQNEIELSQLKSQTEEKSTSAGESDENYQNPA
jgi:hypothetical protein